MGRPQPKSDFTQSFDDLRRAVESDYGRCTYHLACWREWMRGGYSNLDYPDKAGILNGAAFDSDQYSDQADLRSAEAVDAILSDLAPYQSAAVHHFNLSAVYRFPRIKPETAYADALRELWRLLKKRGFE